MARWSCLVLVVYIVLAVNAQSKADESTIVPEPITDTTTSTTTTTSEKTTTTPTTTTSTTTTTTTTEKDNTTTPSTTPAPSTTTAPPTPAPTPDVYPKNVGHWLLNLDKDNVTCLVLDAAIEIKLVKHNGTEINVPKSANISGTCSEDSIVAKLSWPAVSENKTSELALTFKKHGTNFMVTEVSVTVYSNNETVTASLENQTLYETPLNRSYKCIAESPVKLDENVELKIASMRVEPFRTTPFNNNFSKEYECSSDDVSTVVPFAVGISLALLVVIVLVAYLIGRRRSRARGYQSV